MDLAETFDRTEADAIAEFIRLGQEENLHLEFKTVRNANLRFDDDKRNLARCLSGFANSSGGIIIWGVDARKNPQGIDCAIAPAEITPVRLFLTRLNELTGDAVSPIVDRVRHKAIEIGENRGFVVTLVPESESGPHMAKLGEDRYYKRSGDSFYRMEHFDLEDMFGRRQKPSLRVQLEHRPVEGDNTVEDLIFKVLNTGRAVAKHAGFLAQLQNAEITQTVHPLQNISEINNGRPTISFSDDSGVIHPNNIALHVGRVRLRRTNPAESINVEVSFYCENARVQREAIVLVPFPQPVG